MHLPHKTKAIARSTGHGGTPCLSESPISREIILLRATSPLPTRVLVWSHWRGFEAVSEGLGSGSSALLQQKVKPITFILEFRKIWASSKIFKLSYHCSVKELAVVCRVFCLVVRGLEET